MKVTIDGIEIDVPKGTTILQAARMIGPQVAPPAMCYYTKLKTSGGYCRTCIVKVTQGSTANPTPMPKPVASCRTEVMDGMVVENFTNPEILEARKGVVEFLLINHPLDCPICDQAGECKLQDLGYENGSAKTRYEFKRREYEMIDIGDKIKLHMTRCILCYRCVKTAEQITDKRLHGVVHRGDASEISTYIEQVIDNDFSGNVIDVCPVGALTDKTFRFKQRVWFTKPVDAHRDCKTCSGKTHVWLKGEEVVRVTARKDQWDEVEEFICNSCRYDHKKTSDWVIEGPSPIYRNSVISQNHYQHLNELKVQIMKQQKALGFMPIDEKTLIEKDMLTFLIYKLIICIAVFGLSLAVAAYSTLWERKLSALLQDRVGPDRAGPFGLLQPLADGGKMFFKEEIIPNVSNKFLFILGPSLVMLTALMTGAVIPWAKDAYVGGKLYSMQITDINIGILYIFGVVSIGVYGIMIGGWASNNKYALLGAIRASSQMISYEIAMGIAVIALIITSGGTLSLREIVEQQDAGVANIVWQPLGFIIFFVCALAETNRAPFDLPECEAELVGGYHTEYSSMKLGLFLFAEYINMFISSAIMSAFYFGGYNFPWSHELYDALGLADGSKWIAIIGFGAYFTKIFILVLFMWIPWTLPRFRYDQLMNLGWRILLPLSLLNLAITVVVEFLRGHIHF